MEFAVLVLLVIFQALAQSPLFRKRAYLSELKEHSEAFLYQFEKDYRSAYSERMYEDVVLRMLVLSFALAENHYRPASFRAIERIAVRLGLQRFGIAKTTGVMQVTSDGILSDEESVKLAIPIIEEIYDEYLLKANRLGMGVSNTSRYSYSDPQFYICRSGYSYDLTGMCSTVQSDIHSLYGKYCGSNLVNPWYFFKCAWDFVKSEEYESGSRMVFVPHKLMAHEYAGLPFDDWRRIGKNDGFACRASNVQCVAFIGEQGRMRVVVEALTADERFIGSVALLCCSSGQLVLLVLKDHEHFDLIDTTVREVGLRNQGDYEYEAEYFFSNLQSALSSLKNKIEER